MKWQCGLGFDDGAHTEILSYFQALHFFLSRLISDMVMYVLTIDRPTVNKLLTV